MEVGFPFCGCSDKGNAEASAPIAEQVGQGVAENGRSIDWHQKEPVTESLHRPYSTEMTAVSIRIHIAKQEHRTGSQAQ